MDSRVVHKLTLPSSARTLAYATYGSPTGTPLIYLHGFPTSRLEASALHKTCLRRNIRLIAPDRPGFGQSTHDPQRRITSWPADVRALAAHLGLEKFAVLGVSGGGPYALACAAGLPQGMMSAVGVVAGAPVWERGWRSKGFPWYSRLLYLAGNYWPAGTGVVTGWFVGLLRWVVTTRVVVRRIDAWLEGEKAAKKEEGKKKKKKKEKESDGDEETDSLSKGEEDLLEPLRTTERRREWLMGQIFEGFAQGTAGFVHETRLLTHDWGFRFEDVAYETVRMWHGSRDANAPPGTIRDMARRMPHCVLKETDDTHFTMFRHFEEVLDQLVPSMDGSVVTGMDRAGDDAGLRGR